MIAQVEGAGQAGSKILCSPLAAPLPALSLIEIFGVRGRKIGPDGDTFHHTMRFLTTQDAAIGQSFIPIFPPLIPLSSQRGTDYANVDESPANGAEIEIVLDMQPVNGGAQ